MFSIAGAGLVRRFRRGHAHLRVRSPRSNSVSDDYPPRGTIFRMNTDGMDFRTIHFFTTNTGNGYGSFGGLVLGTNNILFGTTELGGTAGGGVIYAINADGSYYRVLHHFSGAVSDGRFARGPLAAGVNGELYGVTMFGGRSDGGTVFRIAPDGSGYRVLHHFDGTGGANPEAGVIFASDGALYGTAGGGGISGGGGVFRLNPDGSNFQVLRLFQESTTDARHPRARLVEGRDGRIYGTSVGGGTFQWGTVFAMNKDGSGFEILYCLLKMKVNQLAK